MHNKKNIAKGMVIATVLSNTQIDSLATVLEEYDIENIENNRKENNIGYDIKEFFAKIVEPIGNLISQPKETIKVNRNIVEGKILEITLNEGDFVQDLSGNPDGYEIVKVITTEDKKLVKEDYDNLRLSGIPKVDLSNAYSDSIPAGAFSNATHLVEFKFPQGITSIDGSADANDGAFFNCSNLSGNLIIPDTVTSIGGNSFNGCVGLTGDLIIPDTVEHIYISAFNECSGFNGRLVLSQSLISLPYCAFAGCSGFTGDLIIPDSVINIEYGVFMNCSGFDGRLLLGNSLTNISANSFSNCTGFTGDLVIPDSVVSIGRYTFQNCSGFTGDLIIGDSVTSIDAYAFNGCNGFTGTLTIGNAVKTIGNYAFCNCTGFTGDLIIPDSVLSISGGAFQDCSGFTGILKLSSSISIIENHAFYRCSGFTGDLVIPEGINSIELRAFANCSGFNGNLILPSSTTKIGRLSFTGCSGFSGDLIIPNNVINVDDSAFSGCTGFNGKLVLSNNLEIIGPSAFSGCAGLTGSLIIPDTVTSIGASAFRNCSGFTGNLIIPSSVKSIYDYAFQGCKGFDGNLILSNSLTLIGMGAFSYCSMINGNVIIPNSVDTIGVRAFLGSNNIDKILIKVDSSDIDTNYKENIINSLPNTSQVVIDIPYSFDVTGIWLETTNKTIAKPGIENIVDGVGADLIDNKGEVVSLNIPSLYKESNISVLRDGKVYDLPKRNTDGKYIFNELGEYQLVITTDLGNVSTINFTVYNKEADDLIEEIETSEIKDLVSIENARSLINSLPEGLVKERLQLRLNNIFPDITLERKTATSSVDIYIKSENMLSLSLDTNSVTFENYSGTEPMEKLKAINITVNSSLPYNLNAYMPTEISNASGGNKMDLRIFNIRESGESIYNQFENTNNKIVLKENCQAGNNIKHSIDLKLDSTDAYIPDVYKATIKLEVEQS